MKKRVWIIFLSAMIFMTALCLKLYQISNDDYIIKASAKQNSYELTVERFRGTIYDCNKEPLVYNGNNKIIASILPEVETVNILKRNLPDDKFNDIYNLLLNNKPFLTELDNNINADGNNGEIECFSISKRYSENQLCNHIIGYCDAAGKGISGIEKSMDDYLELKDSSISIRYSTNALGEILPGSNVDITDTEYMKNQGVSLTIDKDIQKIAEDTAKKYIPKGAVVITEVPNCQIKAMVSLPDYSVNKIDEALNSSDLPLLNRALNSYDVGSIFKIVTSAVALENRVNLEETYECNGSITLGGSNFACFNSTAHGKVDLEQAFAYSCNGYFINLSQNIEPLELINTAKKLGFGKSVELADGLFSSKGNLPTENELQITDAMANFSFGQGSLMATPLQISAMINTIASKGKYTTPTLLKSLINQEGDEIYSYERPASQKVISESTTRLLKKYMISAVEYGTASTAKSEKLTFAAKTGTAQTGQKSGDREVQQCWFAGFFPADNPKYVITVLAEDAQSVSESTAPVFKEIAEQIYNVLF